MACGEKGDYKLGYSPEMMITGDRNELKPSSNQAPVSEMSCFIVSAEFNRRKQKS